MNLLKIFRRNKKHVDTVELPILSVGRRYKMPKCKPPLKKREDICALYAQDIRPEGKTRTIYPTSTLDIEKRK